jgi:hypothetical protein
MKTTLIATLTVTITWISSSVHGHGIPITVGVDTNNKLTVSNTQALYAASDLQTGYAQMILVDNEDAAVMDPITIDSAALNLHGPYDFTTLPGFNVTGMNPDSGLYLQVIPRPVGGIVPVTGRLLWHWSLSLGENGQPSSGVVVDPANESLVIASDADGVVQKISVPQTDGASLSLKVADPTASELGTHQHYLEYLLENPPAEQGLFGFFARLTSPNYGSSDPFLVILDNGVYEDDHPGKILAGALAINNAALLAGDYNHDDKVDAADYALWRNTFGSSSQLAADGSRDSLVNATDYVVWRSNFGLKYPASPAGLGSSVVPEPATATMFVLALLLCCRSRARRLTQSCLG